MVDTVKSGLKEVMLNHLSSYASTATYRWEPVCAYHAVWLQQLENRQADWKDAECKLEFCRSLVWNAVQRGDSSKPQPMTANWQQTAKEAGGKPAPAKAGTKSCTVFNQGKCMAQAEHPADCHICSYCLTSARRVCSHQESFFRRNSYDEAKN